MTTTADDYTSPYLLSDDDILQLGIPETCIEYYRRKHYQDSFGLNSWYHVPELACHTFRTEQVELTFEEGEALAKCYRVNLRIKDDTIKLTNEERELLVRVEQRLADLIETRFPNGAFVKLNTRSPKDTPWREDKDPQYTGLVDSEMNKVLDKTPNNVYSAFLIAMNKSMKVSNGRDAMNLLTRSERVHADLQKNIQFGKELFTSKIEIREWIDEVADHPEMEYRSFVHNKQLNAVSQYFSDTYFSVLHEPGVQDKIKHQITSFFESVKEYIPHPSFVIDFFVKQDGNVMIIELNPFHIGAGACNFQWSTDRNLFMNGPLTFKFTQEEPTQEIYLQFLTIQWEKYLVRHHGVPIEGRHEDLLRQYQKEHNLLPQPAFKWTTVIFPVLIPAIAICLYKYLY